MGLLDSRAKRLRRGPALLLPADAADAMAGALLAYDPALRLRSDRFDLATGPGWPARSA